MVSIVETSEHAAKSYLSTLAVLQLDSILTGAKRVSIKKPKPGNANQKPFERIMIMEYEVTGIGKIKMTVGVRRRTLEKFNTALPQYLVNRKEKKHLKTRCLTCAPYAWRRFTPLRRDAMRAGSSQREEIVKNMRAILTVLGSSSYKEGFTAILSENEVFFNKF